MVAIRYHIERRILGVFGSQDGRQFPAHRTFSPLSDAKLQHLCPVREEGRGSMPGCSGVDPRRKGLVGVWGAWEMLLAKRHEGSNCTRHSWRHTDCQLTMSSEIYSLFFSWSPVSPNIDTFFWTCCFEVPGPGGMPPPTLDVSRGGDCFPN